MNLPPKIHRTLQHLRVSIIVGTLTFLVPTSIFANPSLNNIAAGQVTVQQTQTTTTVNQTSQKAIIDWNSFNIGSGEHTHFQQPNGGVALNRINPTQGASEIYGRLTATGQIILVNPAGIHFGPGAYVNVGGLIASTADISNEDFLNGYYRFTNTPNFRGAITNQGQIIAADHGLVALIGGAVRNDGMIQANIGNVVLASGDEFTMSLAGNEMISFTIDEEATGRAIDYLGNEIEDGIQNYGNILANGGKVLVTAKAASGVLDHVINMEGIVEARSVYKKNGSIVIVGDMSDGEVRIAGKLDASDGGHIETSGYHVNIEDSADIIAGAGGTWLLDPPTIHTSTYGSVIQNLLNAGTNVTLSTGVSGSGDGDIFVDAALTWSSGAELMFGAYRNISFSQPITVSNGGGVIARADLSGIGTGTVSFTGSGGITANGTDSFAKLYYNPTGGNYATPTNFTSNLSGSAPQNRRVAHMLIHDRTDFLAAGAVGSSSIVYSYALASDIDMTGSPQTAPIFTSSFGSNFQGNIDGHDYATGTNRTISNASSSASGLLMTYNAGLIENLNYTSASVTTSGNAAGLIWSNNGTVSNINFSGTVSTTGGSGAGGIVGENQSVIEKSSMSGTVTTSGGLFAGGIVAFLNNGGSIIDSYNAASVSGSTVGGLVGLANGSAVVTITNSYNVGSVTGTNNRAIIGSVDNAGGAISGVYWNSATSSATLAFGGSEAGAYSATSYNDTQMRVAANFAPFDFTNTWTTNGDTTYPQLIQNTKIINTVPIAGTLGASASGQTVSVYADNNLIGSDTADGTGVFVVNVNPDTVYASNPNIIMATTSGTVTGDYIGSFYGPVGDLDITNNVVTVRSDNGVSISNADLVAQTNANLFTFSGNDVTLDSNASLATTGENVYSSIFTSSATPFSMNGDITATNANVTFGGSLSLASATPTITANTSGDVTFNGTVDGAADFIISTSGGTVNVTSAVGGTTPLSSIDINASALSLAADIDTTGIQRFNSTPITLGGDTVLTSTGSYIIASGNIDGGNNALTLDPQTAGTIAGAITNVTTLTKEGAGTVRLTASNSPGQTIVNEGTLQIGNFTATGSLGTGNITLNNASSLVFFIVGAINVDNVISGTGSVTNSGPSNTIFRSDNTYSGGTTISSGTVYIGNGTATGSLGTGAIVNNSGLVFNRTTNLVLPNDISGTGSLTHFSGPRLTLTGTNTYTGTTTISNSFGILQIGDGGTTGTLGTGDVSVNGGLVFNRSDDFTYSNLTSGTGTLTQSGSGTLTLSNANTYSGGTSIDSGTIRVNNDSALGTGTLTFNGGDLYATIVPRTINNPFVVSGDSSVTGSFGSDSISLTGNGTLNNGFTLTLASPGTITMNGDLSGSGSLLFASTTINFGDVTTDNSGFSGTTTINGPNYAGRVVNIGAADNIFGTGSLELTSGNLAANLSTNIDNNFTVNGSFNISGSNDIAFNGTGTMTSGSITSSNTATTSILGNLTGSAAVNVSDGTLIIGQGGTDNTNFGGVVNLTGGTLEIGVDDALGSSASASTLNVAGNANLQASLNTSIHNDVQLSSGTLSITGSNDISFTDVIANSGNLEQNSTGTTTLTGSNTYTGTTTITAGTLQVGNGGTTGSIGSGTIVNNASLAFNRSDAVTVNNDISGTGTVTKTGNSFIVLSGNNSFSGSLNINQGMVVADSNNALGTGGTMVAAGTTLQIADGRTTGGNIILNGTGTTGQNGSLVGAGNATHAGNVILNTDASVGSVTAADSLTLSGDVNGAMALTFAGPGSVNITGNIGNTTAPTAVTSNSDLIIDGSITSNGHQAYNNPVVLMGNSTFAVSGTGTQNISFNNNITGGQDLNLTGTGNGSYNFTFNSGITQNNVTVDGGAGSSNNVLTVGTNHDQTFMVTAAEGGNITGNTGVTGNFNFNNIQSLTGGSGADNFTLDGGSISGSVNGAGGTNTLTADNVANTWNITSNNGGTVTGIGVGFSNIQNLMGGTGLDVFNFTEGVTIAGIIDGGDGVNQNNIKFDTFTNNVTLELGAPVGAVIDTGVVKDSIGNVIVEFNQVQRGDGNNTSRIILPDSDNIKVTFYDDTQLNGEIADPFYFYGWVIDNYVEPSSTTVDNNDIAAIVNQPEINETNNNENSAAQVQAAVGANQNISTSVINTTKITPINENNSVQTGAACYTTGQ